jgi:two-component system, LytTR family, sensor histidine kinase AgrC
MTFWVLVFIAEMLEVKGTLYFFDTFMEKRDGGYRNRYRFFVYCGVLYLAAVTGIWIGMLKCILIILVMSLLNLAYYEVSFRQSFFSPLPSPENRAMIILRFLCISDYHFDFLPHF